MSLGKVLAMAWLVMSAVGCASTGPKHQASTAGSQPPVNEPVVVTPPARPQPMEILLCSDIDYGGHKTPYANDNRNIDAAQAGKVSSVRVTGDGWAVLYSKADYSGSELRIRSPWNCPNLGNIVKYNGPCPGGQQTAMPNIDGDWNDEIQSIRFFPGDWHEPDQCGTHCPDGGPGRCTK